MPFVYEISTPPVYLSLGGALAAFGLIFAVYQLRRPQWDIVLRIRERWQRDLFWILGGVGLLLVLARVFVSEFYISWLPDFLATPVFYEIGAFLFFVASPLSLLYFSTHAKKLFTEKNARKFYEVLVWEIARTNDENINAAIEVLLRNFREICKSAHDTSQGEKNQAARAILDVILSDLSVVRVLTTKRLDALQFIFSVIEEYKIDRRDSGVGIPKLVQNLFFDTESFFYKHLDRDGLALSTNIYDTIFDSPVILTNFNLFGYPTLGFSARKDIGLSGIHVFIEALSRTIKTYLKKGGVPPRNINDGLSYLSNIFGDICFRISREEKRGIDTKYHMEDDWWALHLIADFLGHDYLFIAHQEDLDQATAEREKNATEVSFRSNETINAGIAAAVYKAFEQLSYIENTTDSYYIILELMHGMMHESDLKEGYRPPFEKRMWEQIGANVVRRHYPAALRTYLEIIGFCLASDRDQRQGWSGQQAERMRRLLYVDLKPLIDTNTEMVNKEKMRDALLPTSMDYRNGVFTYRFGFGEGEEKEIAPPPEGATSALDGVDLEHRSHL